MTCRIQYTGSIYSKYPTRLCIAESFVRPSKTSPTRTGMKLWWPAAGAEATVASAGAGETGGVVQAAEV